MNNRPLILKGNIVIREINEYIIGKIIKNKNVINKEMYIQVLDDKNLNLFEKGYKGYIFESKPQSIDLERINFCNNIEDYNTLVDYDVVEIINNKTIRVLYRDDSEDNAIVVTNQCNSNCIMCPDSDIVRNTKENPDIRKLLEQIRCIPDDTKHITITGGEPGLLKENLFKLLEECKINLPNTEFLLLTNGRIFSNTYFTQRIKESIPDNIRIAIPIYASTEILHDEITRVKGSFKQAIIGIKKLLEKNIDIEIRIVVLKKNYKYLEEIAKFIVSEIPKVKMVNIMALEMTGNAYKNKEQVWVNFNEVKEYLYKACITTIKSGIITNLYNFPLCNLDERLYSIAHKSITDYKIRFKEQCEECAAKENCGGFFNSTINVKDIKVTPIK
jgi:His-Xaa-Ser system radical SAM maturase HxsC